VEAEVPDKGPSQLELEFRPIVSRDIGRFSVDMNPMFELPTVTSERRTLEFNYGARVYYRLSRNLVPGVEFLGDDGQIRRFEAARGICAGVAAVAVRRRIHVDRPSRADSAASPGWSRDRPRVVGHGIQLELRGRPRVAAEPLRKGQADAVERVDRHRLVDRRR